MPTRGAARAIRLGAVAALLAAMMLPALTGEAAGEESLSDLRARMDAVQGDLDASAAKIAELDEQRAHVSERIAAIEAERDRLGRRQGDLQERADARANMLYRTGTTGTLEVLLSAADFNDLQTRADMLSRVSLEERGIFLSLARSKLELGVLERELSDKQEELAAATSAAQDESDALQARFRAAQDDYDKLQAQLAARAEQSAPSQTASTSSAAAPVTVHVSGNSTCPVAGPVSFIDSWGAPRAGHTHQGVDMMAASGTPVVAIVSGSITLSSYGESSGNWQILSGDDGNSYWYMHNERNIVNSGHVSVGQQIAAVGSTGNASESAPHLHFEFHPGGGAAVNPTPLVAGLC
jgi:murein DD-endopeptidase MepM/ murein hydrolase activator NlpD